jgi:hypothetical protein
LTADYDTIPIVPTMWLPTLGAVISRTTGLQADHQMANHTLIVTGNNYIFLNHHSINIQNCMTPGRLRAGSGQAPGRLRAVSGQAPGRLSTIGTKIEFLPGELFPVMHPKLLV